jgi:hypothetical protein
MRARGGGFDDEGVAQLSKVVKCYRKARSQKVACVNISMCESCAGQDSNMGK